MLKTWTLRRPTVVFDANNEAHRQAFYEFTKRGSSWGDCKFNFILEEPYNDLITNIHHKIVAWYMQKEFETKTSSRTVKVKQ